MALKQEVRLEERVHQPQTMNLQGRQGVKSLPPRTDVPVDAAGPYCQRNRDSTLYSLSYFVQILHFVRFTKANNSF